MLLRIIDHFHNNPKRIDKLIAVKGLPEDWFFSERDGMKELKRPWEPDIDANIPQEVRSLCEPLYITQRFPPIEKGQNEILDRRRILGVRIDYNSEPGRDMWDRVERYIEETMPRNERVPVAVLCAKDERSNFETYEAKRNSRGSLELRPSPVPEVDLRVYAGTARAFEMPPVPQPQQAPSLPTSVNFPSEAPKSPPAVIQQEPSPEPQAVLLKCKECDYEHKSPQGIRMHAVKRHPRKEMAGKK